MGKRVRRVVARAAGGKEVVRFEGATESDPLGRFAVALDGSARAWILHADAEGFSPASLRDLQPASDLLVRLQAAPALAGTVMDEGRRQRHPSWHGPLV